MTNTELITAYLDNELAEADRMKFEERLQGDSELQQELALQKDVIEGIRMARKAELKQMLNNVPVGQTAFWSGGKIASIIAVVAIAVIGVIYFNTDDEPAAPAETQKTVTTETETPATDLPADQESAVTETDSEEVQAEETPEPVNTENENVAEAQPEDKRPVVAPSFDRDETVREDIIVPGGTILGEKVDTPTSTDVEIDRDNTTYAFHYAFEPGKLKLYGDFNNELYEILEFNSSEGRNWFLEYEDKFYFLDDSSNEIRPLQEIKDAELLRRLRSVE